MSAPGLESLAIDTRLGDLQPEFWSAAGETIIMASSALLIGGGGGGARGVGRDRSRAGARGAHRPRGGVRNVTMGGVYTDLFGFYLGENSTIELAEDRTLTHNDSADILWSGRPNVSWKLWIASPSCLRLFWHCVRRAASRACCTAGSSSATSVAMTAMTTSSSISVKPVPRRELRLLHHDFTFSTPFASKNESHTATSEQIETEWTRPRPQLIGSDTLRHH